LPIDFGENQNCLPGFIGGGSFFVRRIFVTSKFNEDPTSSFCSFNPPGFNFRGRRLSIHPRRRESANADRYPDARSHRDADTAPADTYAHQNAHHSCLSLCREHGSAN
jgi:hypothetical protein